MSEKPDAYLFITDCADFDGTGDPNVPPTRCAFVNREDDPKLCPDETLVERIPLYRRTDADELAHRIAEDECHRRTNYRYWTMWTNGGHLDAKQTEAIAYLCARNLLETHPERPELVRVRDDKGEG